MAKQTLAVKYRPKNFEDVTEQESIKIILKQQLETDTVKNAYLFVGGAGTGKTTCARIFANEINQGKGNPIEMDAASNSSVEDVRDIIQQAKTKSLDSEYKVFIIDECHSISNTGWQAFLKLIEEPPAKSIFIFCTTNPEKIPKTILSRVQRYDFQRISQEGIIKRLWFICENEYGDAHHHIKSEALEYISRIADGGMRDAISLMDKCLSFSEELTLENVVKSLGTVDYDTMFRMNEMLMGGKQKEIVELIEQLHSSGKDLKQFIRSYTNFLLDIAKYSAGCEFKHLQMPALDSYKRILETYGNYEYDFCYDLLSDLIKFNPEIKYSNYVKADIEAKLFMLASTKE